MLKTMPFAFALALPFMGAAVLAQDVAVIEDDLLEQAQVVPGGQMPNRAPAAAAQPAGEPENEASFEANTAAIMAPSAAAPLPAPQAAPASADPQPLTAEMINAGLRDFVAALGATAPVKTALYADMSGNGEQQALVIFDNCDDAGCEWQLVAHKRDGGFQAVGASWGQNVTFEATAGNGAVVNADGVTWAYSGHWIYPFGSLLDHVQPQPGTGADAEAIVAATEFKDVTTKDVTTFKINLSESSDGMEKIHLIGGLHNSFGQSGYPFVVADAQGAVVTSGLAIDMPFVFSAGENGGTTIVWNTPSGYQTASFE